MKQRPYYSSLQTNRTEKGPHIPNLPPQGRVVVPIYVRENNEADYYQTSSNDQSKQLEVEADKAINEHEKRLSNLMQRRDAFDLDDWTAAFLNQLMYLQKIGARIVQYSEQGLRWKTMVSQVRRIEGLIDSAKVYYYSNKLDPENLDNSRFRKPSNPVEYEKNMLNDIENRYKKGFKTYNELQEAWLELDELTDELDSDLRIKNIHSGDQLLANEVAKIRAKIASLHDLFNAYSKSEKKSNIGFKRDYYRFMEESNREVGAHEEAQKFANKLAKILPPPEDIDKEDSVFASQNLPNKPEVKEVQETKTNVKNTQIQQVANAMNNQHAPKVIIPIKPSQTPLASHVKPELVNQNINVPQKPAYEEFTTAALMKPGPIITKAKITKVAPVEPYYAKTTYIPEDYYTLKKRVQELESQVKPIIPENIQKGTIGAEPAPKETVTVQPTMSVDYLQNAVEKGRVELNELYLKLRDESNVEGMRIITSILNSAKNGGDPYDMVKSLGIYNSADSVEVARNIRFYLADVFARDPSALAKMQDLATQTFTALQMGKK